MSKLIKFHQKRAMEEKEKEDQNKLIENLELTNSNSSLRLNSVASSIEPEAKRRKKKKICQFPSIYAILLTLEIIAFILTYIVQKGQYQKIEYSKGYFIISFQNDTTYKLDVNQEVLEKFWNKYSN